MSKKHIVLIGLLLLSGSVRALPRPKGRIELEKILSFGDEGPGLLYQWVGLTTDESGAVYITDLKDFSLKKFDSRGDFLKKTGRKGQGPGEFLSPGPVRYYRGRLYVAQIQHPGVLIFDRELNYLDSTVLNLPVADFQVLDRDRLAVSFLHSGSLWIFGPAGKPLESILYEPVDDLLMNSVAFVHRGNSFYLGFKWQDRILKLRSDGVREWDRHLFGDGSRKPETVEINGLNLPKSIIFKSLALTSDGTIFVLGGDLSEHPSRDVYVLTPEGDLTDRLTLPAFSHMIHIDRNDHLYSRSDQGTRVIKFKIRRMGVQND